MSREDGEDWYHKDGHHGAQEEETSLTITVDKKNPKKGDTVIFTVQLNNKSDDSGLADQEIEIHHSEKGGDDYTDYTGTTDQDGTATFTFSGYTLADHTYTYYAKFAGDETYNSTTSNTLDVTVGFGNSTNLYLSADNNSIDLAQSVTLTAALTDLRSSALIGYTVRIYHRETDGSETTDVTDVTNNLGQISFTHGAFNEAKTVSFYAEFTGDPIGYDPVTSDPCVVDVHGLENAPSDYAPTTLPNLDQEIVYLIAASISGTGWKGDALAPNYSNVAFLDTDDIEWSGDLYWTDHQIIGRSADGESWGGFGGDIISFNAVMVGDDALKNISLLEKWKRAPQILQFTSTYHNYMMPVIIKELARKALKDYPADDYYEYAIKLKEFKPVYVEWENLRKGGSPGGTVSDCKSVRQDTFSVPSGAPTRWVKGADGDCLASTSPLFVVFALLETWLGRPIEDYRYWIAGQAPGALNTLLIESGVDQCFTQACENGFAWWSDSEMPYEFISTYKQSPTKLSIYLNATNPDDNNNKKAGWFASNSSIVLDPQFPNPKA